MVCARDASSGRIPPVLHLSLRHGSTVLRREVDGTSLDLAVQKVRVGAEEHRRDTEHPGEGTGGSAAATPGDVGGEGGAAGAFHLGQVRVDELAARFIGVVHIGHVALTLGGTLPRFLAQLGRFRIVVPVVAVAVVVAVVVTVVVTVVLVLLVSVLFGFTGLFRVFARHAFTLGNDGSALVGHVNACSLVEDIIISVLGGDGASVVVIQTQEDGMAV